MNQLEVRGNWNITKGKLKQKWASLTDDDLRFIEGQEDELIGRIQKRTGEAREAIEHALSAACDSPAHEQAPREAVLASSAVRYGNKRFNG